MPLVTIPKITCCGRGGGGGETGRQPRGRRRGRGARRRPRGLHGALSWDILRVVREGSRGRGGGGGGRTHLAVEPGRRDGRDEELGAVGVRTRVRHRQEPRLRVAHLQPPGLVLELTAVVDGAAARAVAPREIAALWASHGRQATVLPG